MKRRVIAGKNFPARAPLLLSLVAWLVLDRLGAPQWMFGVVGTVLVILWIVWLWDVTTRIDVDVIKARDE